MANKVVYVVVCATGTVKVFDSLEKAQNWQNHLFDIYDNDFYTKSELEECEVE